MWEVVDLPPNVKVLGCKWVPKQFNPNGSVERCKGRLMDRGDMHIKRKGYKHTFSLVAKLTTIRTFIALAST